MLLRAFEALRREVPAELIVIGSTAEELAPLLVDGEGVTALGRVDDAAKERALRAADVLCAPSLGGESFGMVLTEAFAAGTPVVASDIAGYRDVVSARRATGCSSRAATRRRWPRRCATSRWTRRASTRWRPTRGESAERYAWPRIAEQVVDAPTRTRAPCPQPETAVRARRGARSALRPADGLDARSRRGGCRRWSRRRRAGAAGWRGAALLGGAGAGDRRRLRTSPSSTSGWRGSATRSCARARRGCCSALALMCASMLLRAVSWHAILKAAMPDARPRMVDAVQGTTIGVLMSATLPARLGEPSRALVVARRLGRARDRLPVVLGTLVSQTLINVRRAGDPRRRDVHDDRAVRGPPAGAALVRRWRRSGCCCLVLVAPALIRSGCRRARRASRWVAQGRDAASRVRSGLTVFTRPREGSIAISMQLAAWALQWVSCYVLLVALGLEHKADLGAAAAILFAVNVTAVLPVTPSNLGVFQAACMAVLVGAYGVAPGAGARLRDHPAGRRGRDRGDHGRAGAGQGRAVLARGAPARPAQRPGLLELAEQTRRRTCLNRVALTSPVTKSRVK